MLNARGDHRQFVSSLSVKVGEIDRDVIRTFQRHQLFRFEENGGQDVLKRVLRRISETDWGLGYCQGMNSVVGAIIIAQIDPMLKASCFEQKQEHCKMSPRFAFIIVEMIQHPSLLQHMTFSLT